MFHPSELPADVPAELPAHPEYNMAAADYFQNSPPPAQQQPNPTFLAPAPAPPPPQRASSHPGNIYASYQPNSNPQVPAQQFHPPPYQPASMTSPPNQPYAQSPPPRNSFSQQQRPDARTWNQSYALPPT